MTPTPAPAAAHLQPDVNPGAHPEVLEHYRRLRATHQQQHDRLSASRSVASRLMAAAILLTLFLTFRSLHSTGFGALLLACFLVIAACLWYTLRQSAGIARQSRLLAFYDRSLRRADGSEPQSGRTGLEADANLRQPGHLYDRDLDLLGPDSLFGLLATVRTGPGERGLARYLLEPASYIEACERQTAVRELLPQTSLRERIALLGTSSFHQISAGFFDQWLDDLPPAFAPAYRYVLLLTAVLNVALLIAGLIHLRPWSTLLPNLALVLCVQGAVCLQLRKRVLPLLVSSARLQQHIRMIAEGLALLQTASFAAPKLQHLQRLALEPTGAVKLLKSLEGQLTIVEQRPKEYFLVLSLLTAAGTQAAIAIASWKRQHAAAMRSWLAAWAEFEALNALATYAFEHPADDQLHTWPELLPPTHPSLYQAHALAHPLLAAAVPNDIALGAADPNQSPFYLISGSNMAGKSTLLRSIGINAVLAFAGAPVRATSLRLTPLTLGASLALTDSLAEGRSKFLAEVERLSMTVQASASAPLLFLVDEIFSGTNSEDRRTAAAAVLGKLLANGAIGALSTHDLALTDLAHATNRGLNVHMASPHPDDPLAFDYKLKPGINTATNALAIIRMLGL